MRHRWLGPTPSPRSATSPLPPVSHRIHVLAWRDVADVEAGGSELHAAAVARRVGRGRHRGHDAHLVRPGRAAREPSRRLPGHPQGRPLHGVPPRRGGRADRPPRPARRPGRDLERHALADAAVGRRPEGDLGAPRARPDVGHGAAAPTGPRWARSWSAGWPRRSTAARTSSPSRPRHARSWSTSSAWIRPRVSVVPPGVDPRFSPGPARSPRPLVVAVGRLMPVKQFDVLIRELAEVRRRVPDVELVIVGEGAERERLEDLVDAVDGAEWIRLPGRLADDELVALYRQAWVLASASVAEGWGMTITEAAACATPAVVTRHRRPPRRRGRRRDRRAGRPRVPRPRAGGAADRRRSPPAPGRRRPGPRRRAHVGGDGGRHPRRAGRRRQRRV